MRNFRWLWCSNLLFFGGTGTLTLILGWLVYEESRSTVLLGVFGVLRTAPLLLGPVAGTAMALWAAAALYATATLTLLPLRATGRVNRTFPRPGPRQQFWEGIQITAKVPMVVAVLLVTVFANLLLWPVHQSFMPVFAADQLHLGPSGLALLLTSVGAGGLLGSVLMARHDSIRRKGTLFIYGTSRVPSRGRCLPWRPVHGSR